MLNVNVKLVAEGFILLLGFCLVDLTYSIAYDGLEFQSHANGTFELIVWRIVCNQNISAIRI